MGWNGSNSNGKPLSGKANTRAEHPSSSRILWAVAILVTAAVVGVFSMILLREDSGGGEDSSETQGMVKIAETTPSAATNEIASAHAKKTDSSEDEKKPWRMEDNILKKLPNGDFVIRDAKGRTVLVMSRESRRIPGEKPLMFTNRFERVLMQFAIPGEDIPPLPDEWTEQDVEEALSRPVNINKEEDDELTIQRKEGVIFLKEEFAKLRKQGMTSKEFVKELAKRQSLEASLVNETRSQVMQCIINGDLQMAREMQKKFNEHLLSKGLPPLRFPKEVIGEDEPASTGTNNEDK